MKTSAFRQSFGRLKTKTLRRARGDMDLDRLVAQGLELGRGASIAPNVYLDAGHPFLITIGEDAVLTAGVIVMAHDASTRLHTGFTRIGRVVIGARVFVGQRAIILPGSRVGDGSIVAPATVIRGEVPPGSFVTGNPGRVRSRIDPVIEEHRKAAAEGPIWTPQGWTSEGGITDERKSAQREVLAGGASGYLDYGIRRD